MFGRLMHTIKTAASLTGLNANTIRTWERRYKVISPQRDAKRRRSYSEDDIQHLGILAKLVENDYSIGKLAGLDRQQLKQLLQKIPHTTPVTNIKDVSAKLSGAIKTGDYKKFRLLIGLTLSLFPPHIAAEHVLAPALRKIGDLWESAQLDVGAEHTFSRIIIEHVSNALGVLRWAASGPLIAFTTVNDEQHEIGSLMACYIASSQRYRSHYFGPNMPVQSLMEHVEGQNAIALAISVIRTSGIEHTMDKLKRIDDALPGHIEFWIGKGSCVDFELGEFSPRTRIFSSYEPYYRHLRLLNP